MYMIVVAEGVRNASGEMLYDEAAGVDAFGHKKLAGAAKYVRQQLERRLKADPGLLDFMKASGMYVPGIYEMPEVREVTPGHLVRSGGSSAYDVNFGYAAGAAAVALLRAGISGRTVVSVDGNRVSYMATEKAIVHREVDVSGLSLFESLGTCFGREPLPFAPELVEETALPIPRHL
jgi:6-phosphofructokinase 1